MTIDDIKRRHIEFGGKFFDKEHMRWFKSRVHSKVYEGTGGVYFVTSRLRSTRRQCPHRLCYGHGS